MMGIPYFKKYCNEKSLFGINIILLKYLMPLCNSLSHRNILHCQDLPYWMQLFLKTEMQSKQKPLMRLMQEKYYESPLTFFAITLPIFS